MATAPLTPFHFSYSSRPAQPRWPLFLSTWLPVLFFVGVFAVESTAPFGANRTSLPLYSLVHSIFGSGIDRNWSEIHHLIRKTGHFTGYGLFSLVCFRGFQLTLRRMRTIQSSLPALNWTSHGLALAATFLVASADEIHQSFLPNRTGCFSDVLLDTAGALTLQLGLFLALRLSAIRDSHSELCGSPSKTARKLRRQKRLPKNRFQLS